MEFRIVILAAGKGKRMGDLNRPKALTLVAGKPILQYLVDAIATSHLGGVPVVVIGPEGIRLCDAFGGTCEYIQQMEQLGTGHAVSLTQKAVLDADALIVLYGDHPFIASDTLKRLADRHRFGDNTITMVTTKVEDFEGRYAAFAHWGRILRDPSSGHIIGIREYKDATDEQKEIHELNPALYCFSTQWLWENIQELSNRNAQAEYYLTDLIGMAVSQGKRISSLEIVPEEAIGINTPQEREIAEQIFVEKKTYL